MRGSLFFAAIVMSLLTGCEEAASPMLVQPTVSADRVPDAFDFFFATDAAHFVAAANERMKPAELTAQLRDTLTPPLAPGYRVLARTDRTAGSKVFFGQKIVRGLVGVVMPRTTDDRLIVPVEWLHDVVTIGLADETAAHDWYVAMSQRLATAGKASGIALFPNGNAMGINIDLIHGEGDDELVARVKFLRAGEYKADEWGPRIEGESVANSKMNGHDGIRMEDLLRQQLTGGGPPSPKNPAPPPAPPQSTGSLKL